MINLTKVHFSQSVSVRKLYTKFSYQSRVRKNISETRDCKYTLLFLKYKKVALVKETKIACTLHCEWWKCILFKRFVFQEKKIIFDNQILRLSIQFLFLEWNYNFLKFCYARWSLWHAMHENFICIAMQVGARMSICFFSFFFCILVILYETKKYERMLT